MRVFTQEGRAITLGPADFVAQGAQGSVYARDGVAYKIYHDASAMVSDAKLARLAALDDSDVLGPTGILCDQAGGLIGYTMVFVAQTYPLCRLYPRAFRVRHGVGTDLCTQLVYTMAATLERLHVQGCLVVDFNPFNILVDAAFERAYFIDADSYQLPGHPATALMESVRDRHAPVGTFSVGTDWFAFAVTTFQLFTGVHPYRGKHPTLKSLDDRMQAQLSVFDPSVVMPPAASPVSVIPTGLRAWYRDVFENRARTPPPSDPGAVDVLIPHLIRDGATVQIKVTDRFRTAVRAVSTHAGRTLVVTDDGTYLDGKRIGRAPRGAAFVGFSKGRGLPVVGALEANGLWLWDAHNQQTLAFGLSVDALCESEGRLYGRSGKNLVELRLVEVGQNLVAAPQVVAHVAQHATRLYEGVAIQGLLGATHATLLGARGSHTLHLPELDPARVIDARYQSGVLMVLTRTQAQWARWVFRFDLATGRYDARQTRLSGPESLDFVVLATGVCVALGGDGGLELFVGRVGAQGSKHLTEEALDDDLRLVSRGGQLGFVRGGEVGTLRMR